MHSITCADCGASYAAKRSDATKCASCRLLAILLWSRSYWVRSKRCACGELYRPLRRGDRRCGACTPAPRNAVIVRCRMCKTEAPQFELIDACAVCVKSPEVQPRVVAGLLNGQKQRKETTP